MTQHTQQSPSPATIIFSASSSKFTFYGRSNRGRISIFFLLSCVSAIWKDFRSGRNGWVSPENGTGVPAEAGSRRSPSRTNGIALLSAGCSMTHGKYLGCLRCLFGGQVYIAQRFATQLIQAKKPRISQAAKLKLALSDRQKKILKKEN